MNRRIFKSLTLWIVPLLIARAMIPAGFMLSVDADGLGLVFCSGSISSVAAGHAQHEGHAGNHDVSHHADHSQQHQGHDSGGGHENAPCPFSLAASIASADAQYFASAAILSADEIFEFLSAPIFSVGPLRADRIRGPPSLA